MAPGRVRAVTWVWVVVAAAVGGLVMLAVFAVVLWRKAKALFHEVGELGRLAEGFGALADGVDSLPGPLATDPGGRRASP